MPQPKCFAALDESPPDNNLAINFNSPIQDTATCDHVLL